jgi:anti-sigma factor RsiW
VSESSVLAHTLHAYHDGELGWWARLLFERRLSKSAELRGQLEALRELSSMTAESEEAVALPAGAVWEGLEGRLRAVDAAIEAEGPVAAPAEALSRPAWLGWRPVSAAAAAAGALALLLVLRPGAVPVVEPPIASGTVRYLDAGDRSVMVQEQADVTIIWVMGGTEDV